MTTDQELKLDRIARHLGARVIPDIHQELHPEDLAGWFPRSRRILYNPHMSYQETICAVAHELGHAYYDDTCSDGTLRHLRQEARADRWAVRALITARAYEDAEHLVGSHPGALADELSVTVEYIKIWRDLYSHAIG